MLLIATRRRRRGARRGPRPRTRTRCEKRTKDQDQGPGPRPRPSTRMVVKPVRCGLPRRHRQLPPRCLRRLHGPPRLHGNKAGAKSCSMEIWRGCRLLGTDLVHSGPLEGTESVGTDLVHSGLLDLSTDLLIGRLTDFSSIDRDCSSID